MGSNSRARKLMPQREVKGSKSCGKKQTNTHAHTHIERGTHIRRISGLTRHKGEREEGRRGEELRQRPSHGARATLYNLRCSSTRGSCAPNCLLPTSPASLAPLSSSSSSPPSADKQLASCVKGQRGATALGVKRKLRQCRESPRGAERAT